MGTENINNTTYSSRHHLYAGQTLSFDTPREDWDAFRFADRNHDDKLSVDEITRVDHPILWEICDNKYRDFFVGLNPDQYDLSNKSYYHRFKTIDTDGDDILSVEEMEDAAEIDKRIRNIRS